MRKVFGHRLHSGPDDPFRRQSLRIPPDDASHRSSGGRQVLLLEFPPDIPALRRQAPHSQGLPAPQGLHGEARRPVNPRRQQADTAGDKQCAQRQSRRQTHSRPEFLLRRLGKSGPEELLCPGDGLSHIDNWVGHPRRVSQQAVQNKAADRSF